MTAVALYDALAQVARDEKGSTEGLVRIAEKLVASSLEDLGRLTEYEQQCFMQDWRDARLHRVLTQSIYEMYQDWAREAEQVLVRVRRSAVGGESIARASELEKAAWRVAARLKLNPDQIERATEQVRRGETIPAEELRHELRARLRA